MLLRDTSSCVHACTYRRYYIYTGFSPPVTRNSGISGLRAPRISTPFSNRNFSTYVKTLKGFHRPDTAFRSLPLPFSAFRFLDNLPPPRFFSEVSMSFLYFVCYNFPKVLVEEIYHYERKNLYYFYESLKCILKYIFEYILINDIYFIYT